jgi:hypothetical protein
MPADTELGLADKSLVSVHWANVGAHVEQSLTGEPELEALFHVESIRVAIGIKCTFCMFWLLIVFILYRIARLAF